MVAAGKVRVCIGEAVLAGSAGFDAEDLPPKCCRGPRDRYGGVGSRPSVDGDSLASSGLGLLKVSLGLRVTG